MPKSASEIPAQHQAEAHARAVMVESNWPSSPTTGCATLEDRIAKVAATARAEGRAEGLREAARIAREHGDGNGHSTSPAECVCIAEHLEELLIGAPAVGTVPQVGTGSEYERGRADGRRLTLEAAQLALVASGFDAFGPLYRRIEDRAELPTDTPQEQKP